MKNRSNKPLLLVIQAILYLGFSLAWSQTVPTDPRGGGTPGGGGTPSNKDTNPANPNNWQIGQLVQNGEDVATRIEHDQNGNDRSASYRHTWGTGQWTCSVGGTTSPTEIAFPISQDCGHSSSLTMSSQGWMQRSITWIGIGPGPESVILKVSARAWITYQEGTGAELVNSVVENSLNSEVITKEWNLFPNRVKETKGGNLVILPLSNKTATIRVDATARVGCLGVNAALAAFVDPLAVSIDDRELKISVNGSYINYGRQETNDNVTWTRSRDIDGNPVRDATGHWSCPLASITDTRTYKKAQKLQNEISYTNSVNNGGIFDVGLRPRNRVSLLISNFGFHFYSPLDVPQQELLYGFYATPKNGEDECYKYTIQFGDYSYDADSAPNYSIPSYTQHFYTPLWQCEQIAPLPLPTDIPPVWWRYDTRDFPVWTYSAGEITETDMIVLQYYWDDTLRGNSSMQIILHSAVEEVQQLGATIIDVAAKEPFDPVEFKNIGYWNPGGQNMANAIVKPVDKLWLLSNQIAKVVYSTAAGIPVPGIGCVAGFQAAMLDLNLSSKKAEDWDSPVSREHVKGYFSIISEDYDWKSHLGYAFNADECTIMEGNHQDPGSSQIVPNIQSFCWGLGIRPIYHVEPHLTDFWGNTGFESRNVNLVKEKVDRLGGTKYFFYHYGLSLPVGQTPPTDPFGRNTGGPSA